jgi:hypothetical protein
MVPAGVRSPCVATYAGAPDLSHLEIGVLTRTLQLNQSNFYQPGTRRAFVFNPGLPPS